MYELVPSNHPLSQGDIINDCPVFRLEPSREGLDDPEEEPTRYRVRVVVMTQACDLAQQKSNHVLVAVVHATQDLVALGLLKPSFIRDNVRRHQVHGWYFLPAPDEPLSLSESIIDLRDLHTVSRRILDRLISEGKRVCRIQTPYREHLAQHFAVTYMRIGLPEPYKTET
ncbi:MAG: hypothetical protein ABI353_12840 [Isosphaeraceae bacterium]